MLCRWSSLTLALLLPGCVGQLGGNFDAGDGADGGANSGAGSDAGPGQDGGLNSGGGSDAGPGQDGGTLGASGQITGAIRVNNFGWRTADSKIAVLLGHAGETVQLVNASTGSIAGTFMTSGLSTDKYSGDQVSTVDFSSAATAGEFYLYLPASDLRSYDFRIADDVYDIVGAAAVKSYYFQRCNHDKALPYATDALLGFSGIGGKWVDGACHAGDSQAPAGPGSANDGTLDLHGGWHDAGDYQKTLWGRGVPQMLFAYEVNPNAWTDGQLHIPESGNGIPDLLDEAR